MTPNRQETSDEYSDVIANLTDTIRVITCKDDLQWILQKRMGGSAKRPWRGKSFCTTRQALIRCSAALGAPTGALEVLPEVFRSTTKQTTRRKEQA